MTMYEGAMTAVKTEDGLTDWFKLIVGLHLYADDLVLMAESEDELRQKLRNWKDAMEAKGVKVNVNKTKVMFSGKCGESAIE